MIEWVVQARTAMDLCERRVRSRRESIVLHRPLSAVINSLARRYTSFGGPRAYVSQVAPRRAPHVAG
jgi:hypothetical protein